MPKHVIAHMQQVKNVCAILSDALIKKGHRLEKGLVLEAAAIHDALRVCDFKEFIPEKFPQSFTEDDLKIWLDLRKKYGKIGHSKALGQVLREIGEPQLANLVEKHDFLQIDNLHTWEEKTIYYADKRVDQDRITPLLERLKKGKERNVRTPQEEENHIQITKKILALEKEFTDELGTLPI